MNCSDDWKFDYEGGGVKVNVSMGAKYTKRTIIINLKSHLIYQRVKINIWGYPKE